MIVLLSPTKTMKHIAYNGKSSVPFFSNQTGEIAEVFSCMNIEELKEFYLTSDKIVEQAYVHWQNFVNQPKTIALVAYQGEAFRNLDARTLTKSEISKVNHHLRILSALYGLLRPLDAIGLYRLDLTKNFPKLGNGVTYWRDIVTDQLIEEIMTYKYPIIVNCSSNEYTQLIDVSRIKQVATWIQINFEYLKEGQRVNISMLAKAARGTLARELSLRPITSISQMKRYLPDYLCEIDKKRGIVTFTQSI
jgi:cytoplasmic iron level regulating protein YaaA (DUF328/UPF0246 family)